MRTAAALVVPLLLLVVAPRLFENSTWALLQSVPELGLVSGWRCAETPIYVYEPSRERADQTLLADPPEVTIMQHAPGAEIDRVEANLRGGETLVWSRALGADGGLDNRRVYVLAPGRLQAIDVELLGGRATACTSHLGDWKIVGEHALG